MSGKLIVIEGTDGTGKETQTNNLVSRLGSSSVPVLKIGFPRYDEYWGKKVREYLEGKHQAFGNDPWPPSFLYAMDRYVISPQIKDHLSRGIHVLLDRYSESNLGYQGAKLTGKERSDLIQKLTYFENEVLGVPAADYVLYLDLPVEESVKIIHQRIEAAKAEGKKYKDIHEEDVDYLRRVRDTYLELASERNNWVTINCMKSPTERLTREDVAVLVWNQASKWLNL